MAPRPVLLVLAIVLGGLAVGGLGGACTAPRALDAPAPPPDPTRLSHEQHAQLPCEGCHRGVLRAGDASAARPGADDHRPCDDGACHQQAFLGAPGPLCRVCHTRVAAQPVAAPLAAYPPENAWQAQPPRFSHQRHLDAARMEAAVGFHVACADCHERDGKAARPDHATCARCHSAEAGLPRAPRMEQCAGCHQRGQQVRTRALLIRGDLHFDHARHRADRKGVPIRCEACHGATARATSRADHAPPRIASCVTCHDDTDRTPAAQRMRACETCHAGRASTLTSLAPRDHLPATERPLDHTLGFRRDHAEVAERDARRCATCHTRMSGNPRQACDECHQTMMPGDHRITWRELDHGPEAAADRGRCARCHVVEFCTACHAQRPRSHGLVGSFTSEHGRLARINVRSCTTCHGESECAACHAASAPPRLRGGW